MHDVAGLIELLIWAVFFAGAAIGLIASFIIKKIIRYFKS